MCGIAGLIERPGQEVDEGVLGRMAAAMRHRGPDAQGVFVQRPDALGRHPGVGLGHVRLKIIDLAGGTQPMPNEDETVWVVFNGEIYNFRELRRLLEARGHRFRTRSDTEVIVHAYEEFGEACVGRLRGMFAFAVWDARTQRLLLARDRLGKKPLVYAQDQGRLAFASELRGLLQVPWVTRAVDASALHDYLTFLCVPAPRTIYEGVRKLPPAHCLSYAQGTVRVWRYWELAFTPKLRMSAGAAAEQLHARLEEAVRIRLVSDVPLGALLSGGMDSSTIVALMSRLGPSPVRTFSIGFEEDAFNELPYARLVARRYGTQHQEAVVRPDAVELLPMLVDHYGEPFADSSAIPSFYLARMARQSVTVVLNGDGGDEAFGGYYRHMAMRWADWYQGLPAWTRRLANTELARTALGRLPLANGRLNAQRFLDAAGLSRVERIIRWSGFFTEAQKAGLYGGPGPPRAPMDDSASRHLERLLAGLQHLDGVDAALAVDTAFYLPNDLLVKMDIATMAQGLEARSPLLDHELLEFAARLPAWMKVRGTQLKWLLKRTERHLVPSAIRRRRKQGFAVPLDAWFRGPLEPFARAVLCAPRAAHRRYFDPGAVQRLLDAHRDGRANAGHHLWILVVFELWHQRFIDTAAGLTVQDEQNSASRCSSHAIMTRA